ncbi:LuxR C-terminal-related transcriptional regulator [Mucilaginibacter sp. AW1-3]
MPPQYTKLKSNLPPDCYIPDDFFLAGGEGKHCLFLLSCLNDDKFLYLDESFEDLTGYSNTQFANGGRDFWFSRICPEDMDAVSLKIIGIHKAMFDPAFNPHAPAPLVLEYRFKHAEGHWIWLRDTRYLVSFSEQKVIDKVLCRFETMPVQYDDINALNNLLQKDQLCNTMLEVAMIHQNAKQRQNIKEAAPSHPYDLTKREKEILRLIAEGLSTKMIADKCYISTHTVETHRKHLLEKFNVKNSMELVKEASKVFWL